MIRPPRRWHRMVWLCALVLAACVLSFYRTSGAAPQGGQLPFDNAVAQRNEMIRELKQISTLLKEQNELLRAMAQRRGDVAEKGTR